MEHTEEEIMQIPLLSYMVVVPTEDGISGAVTMATSLAILYRTENWKFFDDLVDEITGESTILNKWTGDDLIGELKQIDNPEYDISAFASAILIESVNKFLDLQEQVQEGIEVDEDSPEPTVHW